MPDKLYIHKINLHLRFDFESQKMLCFAINHETYKRKLRRLFHWAKGAIWINGSCKHWCHLALVPTIQVVDAAVAVIAQEEGEGRDDRRKIEGMGGKKLYIPITFDHESSKNLSAQCHLPRTKSSCNFLLWAKGDIAQTNWPYNDADNIQCTMQPYKNNSRNLMISQ